MHQVSLNGREQPINYINTKKGTLLAFMMLIEALGANGVLYAIINYPHTIPTVIGSFLSGIKPDNAFLGLMSAEIQLLTVGMQYFLVFELLLIALAGFGAFSLRIWHKGAGIVEFCHYVRFVGRLLLFIDCIIGIIRNLGNIMRAASNMGQTDFSTVFVLLGSYYGLLSIIIEVGSIWLTMKYHFHVGKVTGHISKEIKAKMVLNVTFRNKLRGEAALLAGILFAGVLFSIYQLLNINGIIQRFSSIGLSGIAEYLELIQMLNNSAWLVIIAPILWFCLKYFLVSRCAADFDRVH